MAAAARGVAGARPRGLRGVGARQGGRGRALREDVAPAEWVRQGKLREAAAAEANAETDSYNTPVPAPQIPSI